MLRGAWVCKLECLWETMVRVGGSGAVGVVLAVGRWREASGHGGGGSLFVVKVAC